MLKPLRPWWALAVLVAGMLVLISACGSDSKNDNNGGTPEPAGTEAPRPTLTPVPLGSIITPDQVLEKDAAITKRVELDWGWMFEITGPPQVQGFGQPTGDGVKIAVQEINEAGGFQVGDTIYTIKLIEHDTQSTVENTLAVVRELVNDDHVKVIFGPATLGEPEITPFTQANKVIHLCPCQQREQGALSSIEKAHGESQWAFQTLLPFSLLISQAGTSFRAEYPDLHSMSLICQNSATGRDICERTKTAYASAGVQVLGDIQYFPVGTTDYRPYLTRLQSGDPDYLFNYDDPLSTIELVKQALQLGIGRLHLVTVPADLVQPLIGFKFDVPISAGAAPRNQVVPTSPEVGDYFQRYKDFLGGANLPPAGFVSLMTYDYVYMVAAAMQQANTVEDTTAIAKALETLHYNGVAEDDLYFNSGHFAVHGTEPCTVVYGEPKATITCIHNAAPDAAKY